MVKDRLRFNFQPSAYILQSTFISCQSKVTVLGKDIAVTEKERDET